MFNALIYDKQAAKQAKCLLTIESVYKYAT